MNIKPIALILLFSMSLSASTVALRGSIISADGAVIAKSSIDKSGEVRIYPYGKALSPFIGYTQKKRANWSLQTNGINGLEKFFDEEIKPEERFFSSLKGKDIKLNIPMSLQTHVENITDMFKKELDADEVMAVVMESKSGKVLSLATSNRFNPSNVRTEDNSTLMIHASQVTYEPGTIITPIIFAMLLDKGLVNPSETVNCHNGKYVMGRKTITDEHKFKTLSAEDVIVHSSYIGISQLAQRLEGKEFSEGLNRFGFAHFSGTDLPYELRGSIPSSAQLDNYLYKAIVSYGYGLKSNAMQLIKAYNAINNNGRMINPMIVDSIIDDKGKIETLKNYDPIQVISPATVERMKKVLIKTVNEGTATIAKTKGLEVGGKTGAVHLAKNGKYLDSYNTSFIGFANDDKHAYTIAIITREPRSKYSPSISAAPVFKAIIDTMIKEKYLKPRL